LNRAMHSNTCAALLAWSDRTDESSLRRLQLAAEAHEACLLVLFRPLRLRHQRSPAALRIQLTPGTAGTLELQVFKNRGGPPEIVVVRIGGESRSADG